jgi:hypothetical protein
MPTKVYPDGVLVRYADGVGKCRKGKRHVLTHEERRRKSYRIDFKAKRAIFGAALEQSARAAIHRKTSKHRNQIFFTLTLPKDEYKRVGLCRFLSNEPVKRFGENMRKRHFDSFLWVRELTKANTPHWHCLALSPYVPVSELQKAWNSATGLNLPNSLRTKDGQFVVKSVDRAMAYAAKYISKTQTASVFRLYGVSGITTKAQFDFWNLSGGAEWKPKPKDSYAQIGFCPRLVALSMCQHFTRLAQSETNFSRKKAKIHQNSPKKADGVQLAFAGFNNLV